MYRTYKLSGTGKGNGQVSTYEGYVYYPYGSCTPAGSWKRTSVDLTTGDITVFTGTGIYGGNVYGATEVVSDSKRVRTDSYGNQMVEMLSDLDTVDAAIARIRPAPVWSGWSGGICCAKIAQSNIQYSFQDAELKLVAKGPPNAVAKVDATYTQTDFSSYAVSKAVQRIELWCDGAGDADIVLSVPKIKGTITCVTFKQVE